MVVLNKIYTRAGDDGRTALSNGERRAKHDLRLAACGTIDEANATIGLARLHTAQANRDIDDILEIVQNDLFDLGADLATPEDGSDYDAGALRIIETQVKTLERQIDHFNKELEPLRSFILPGGSPAAAYLHLARTVVRRAERMVVALSHQETVNPASMKYINRLSDFLFVAARYMNGRGKADHLWKPGKNR